MDTSDLPPKALIKLMKDDHEIEIFEDFKATSVNKLHPGFTQKAVYDDQRALYAPLPSAILSSTLSEAMLHTDLMADLKYEPQGCGWEDVLNCIDIAKASYDEKGKGNKVRAWSRNADTTVDFLKSLAGIIPDEKGLSVLRQGLVIIFQAWQTRIKNKEEILRQLEDLPVLLSTATDKWKLYSRDERLKDAVRNLYETVVDSLSILIRILLRKQEGSLIRRNMHRIPTVESQRIDEITNTVTRAKEALEVCVNRLEHERQAKTYEASTSTLSEARAIRQTIHEHHGIMMQEMNDMETHLSQLRLTDDKRTRDILKECFREVLASRMQTGLYRLVEETEHCQRIGSYNTVDAPRLTNTEKLLISKDELLLHLNLGEVGSIAEDVDRIRQQGTNVASEGRELARKIMSMAQFTEWVQEDRSRLLLVDGHCKDLGNGKTSPLSVLCASLASNFAESNSLVILQYYCGHHGLDSNGLPAGPLGLIRSLLAQVLRKPDDVLPQEIEMDRELYDRVNPDDIDNLCEIFGVIFSQINQHKITLCIIDEIAEFEGERGGWADGMSLVAFQLRWMVHQFQGPQRLKVLMSSANKSAVVTQLLEDNDKISFRGSGLPNHSPGRLVMSNSGFSFP